MAKHHLDKWVPRIIGIIAFLIVLVVGMLMCFWLFWPQNLLSWHNLHIDSPQTAGTYITYHVNVCKYTNAVATVQRDVVGINGTDSGYVLPISASVAEHGCGKANLSLYLPPTVAPGTYHLRDAVSFHPNPLRTITYIETSNTFTVLPAKV